TMILWGISRGERMRARQLVGLVVALSGLVALVLPGVSAPSWRGATLMITAGIAWGIYSLRGKGVADPRSATAGNFLRAFPFAVVMSACFFAHAQIDLPGLSYAILSGGITSGLGYVIWYTVLPSLKGATAATVQLSVPVFAALSGVLLLGEPLTIRFILASIGVLGGIALVVIAPRRARIR
ncbi:MAG: DMT family transporter, partial [Verrucomicrobiota bacterium]|nr:DMT family transporter [Verrucomicrobiota bacterium]